MRQLASLFNKKSVTFFVILAVVLFCASVATQGEDNYDRVFREENLLRNYGMKVEQGQGYAGMMLMSGPCVSLEEGEYIVSLRYQASSSGNYVMLLDEEEDYGWSNISCEENAEQPIVYLECILNRIVAFVICILL